jgi:hypothetical protein
MMNILTLNALVLLSLQASRSPNAEGYDNLRKSFDAETVADLQKSFGTADVAAAVPEDLETEAFNTQWNEASNNELTFLKMCPRVTATQIEHKFARVDSYGGETGMGFFGEGGLPGGGNPELNQYSVKCRLVGRESSTFQLADLEKTINALGANGAGNINDAAARLAMMGQKNKAMYFSDTRVTRQGANGIRWKGLLQQIEEGTDGTVGDPSPYGSHVIDMEGQLMTADNVSLYSARVANVFGNTTTLLMDKFVRRDFERSLDTAQRLQLPVNAAPFKIGQRIAGIQTGDDDIYFHTDNMLGRAGNKEAYTDKLNRNAPTTRPTVVATAQADNAAGVVTDTVTSKWTADYAGNVFYVVVEEVGGIQGLGTRYPATPGTFVSVSTGQEVKLELTPGNALADCFRVYRGTDANDSMLQAHLIAEVSNSNGGAKVYWFDNNTSIPNTSTVFALPIRGVVQQKLQGENGSYEAARAAMPSLMGARDTNTRNGVAFAELGPSFGRLEMGRILFTSRQSIMYSAGTPIVRAPRWCYVFKNVGSSS